MFRGMARKIEMFQSQPKSLQTGTCSLCVSLCLFLCLLDVPSPCKIIIPMPLLIRFNRKRGLFLLKWLIFCKLCENTEKSLQCLHRGKSFTASMQGRGGWKAQGDYPTGTVSFRLPRIPSGCKKPEETLATLWSWSLWAQIASLHAVLLWHIGDPFGASNICLLCLSS